MHKKECLDTEVTVLQKQQELSNKRWSDTMEELKQAREMVSKLQCMLKMSCDLEDENQQLKEKVTNMADELAAVREEHTLTLSEAQAQLQELRQAHKEEIEKIKATATSQRESEVGLLKQSLQHKLSEISRLQGELADLEREKHTELARLRLEYDTKLLKLQRENSRVQQHNTRVTNKGNDIFRQKLLNARSEADQEINSLKHTIADLQRRLETQTGGMSGSKRKF
ncbi:coiled-coil domain-containing protein 152-like [Diadema antillarum]|uniref:coiled-coil domain-containing protein 152-like n=2 Tax=Diadema antillarum TaxID=105358 RepID=UPI003A84E9B6